MPGSSISTHVLDVERGQPARGVRVELFRAGDLVSAAETNDEGRIPELAAGLASGSYRLVFHPATDFFSRVELEIMLGEGHYHVPLLVAPYSCTTYRGS